MKVNITFEFNDEERAAINYGFKARHFEAGEWMRKTLRNATDEAVEFEKRTAERRAVSTATVQP